MKKEYIIPVFVPHLGCPNDCTFCNQKKISGQTKMVKANDVRNTIENYLNNINTAGKYVEVAFFGGSFTGIEVDKQKELLEVAYEYICNKKVDSIRLSTRPDYINDDILKMLKKYGVKTIELGVQSTNEHVLERSQRGHTFEDVKRASKLIRKYGFTLGHQMMVGLQDSSRDDEIQTAKDLISLKPKIIRIYPVLVIKGTKLEDEYLKGKYVPLTVDQAAETSKILLKMFEKKGINVIRIGLQSTDEISDPNSNEKSQVVAGPYHSCFRQIVESKIWYDRLVKKIKKVSSKVTKITIFVNKVDINYVVGYKKMNIIMFKEMCNLDVRVRANKKIKKSKFKVKTKI